MGSSQILLLLLVSSVSVLSFMASASSCSGGNCQLLEKCSDDKDCAPGLYCLSCTRSLQGKRCVRSTYTDQFKLLNNSLPFNKYAFLTTHNSFSIKGEPSRTGVPRVTAINQEDCITQQLQNGVRALMLDVYEFKGDIWLCHSFKGKCFDFTAFRPAIETLREVGAFLSKNPSEIVTLILEDYVETPKALTKLFTNSGLMKYWFPLSSMPNDGQNWPLVKDMIAKNQRLVVFTSIESKQKSEGIAYQWNYMVENQYGNDGIRQGSCSNRNESSALDDKSKSLVLVNHFRTLPVTPSTCRDNSKGLIDSLQTCYHRAGKRWANFVAVDYYKRSDGGGAFEALDLLNGELICGCRDVHACKRGPGRGCNP